MASGESKPVGGFTVTDRRSFGEGAKTRDEASDEASHKASDVKAQQASDVASQQASDAAAAGLTAAFPPVDFHTFVLSLGSSALLHLGEIENPNDGVSQKD